GYPELKKFSHLVGNWGGAWHKQKEEFENFPGAILATTNCVLIPKDSYSDRLFTCSVAGIRGVKHIRGLDFSPLIDKAISLPKLTNKEGRHILAGFHHSKILELSHKIISLIKDGRLRHIFLVGGCDTPGKRGDYYRRFAQIIPQDCLIVTLACGKYRFNDLDFGDIDGIPRLIDLGQCNNAYSAIVIVKSLSEALSIDINNLPVSLVLTWFEQKAVAILFSLLSLNIKGIYLGPLSPEFISKGIFNVLKDKFNIKLISTPESDIKTILNGKR
ncbi:MAG: hydroxylamine reductase, partial [Candidatus Omnitrophica bacterium]|nr:hydroxylamine reductase [Candidatus Omnitrophota bacterium]